MNRHWRWSAPLLVLLGASGCWILLWQEKAVLTTRLAELNPSPARPLFEKSRESSVSEAADHLTGVRREVDEAREKLGAVKKAADELTGRLPVPTPGEVVVSFGRLEDMGRAVGDAVKGMIGAVFEPLDESVGTDGAGAGMMVLIGRVTEIRAFENQPGEIAEFQANALQRVFNLTPDATAQARELVKTTFTAMAADQLIGDHRPAENDGQWKDQRTKALQQLMLELRPLLPDQANSVGQKSALLYVLNLGAGFDPVVKTVNGQTQLEWTLYWPVPPW